MRGGDEERKDFILLHFVFFSSVFFYFFLRGRIYVHVVVCAHLCMYVCLRGHVRVCTCAGAWADMKMWVCVCRSGCM
jgi:hypothetical protein